MGATLMNSKHTKGSNPNRTMKNLEKYGKVIQDNKFKISTLIWSEKLELADELCSLSDI